MQAKDMKIWKRVVGSVKGGVGETDFKNHIIKIDKKKHKKSFTNIPKQDNTIINSILHEESHVEHSRMTEKAIRKMARQKVNKMGRKLKAKYYNRYK